MRRKKGFVRWRDLKNKLQAKSARKWSLATPMAVASLPQAWVMPSQAWVTPMTSLDVGVLAFFARFQLFFRLKTPRNLKWIFFTLYCLQKSSKNHRLQSSYPWSFTWCLYLSIYMISHFKRLKTPMRLHDLGWQWITLTRLKIIQYVPQTLTTPISLNLFAFKCKEKY